VLKHTAVTWSLEKTTGCGPTATSTKMLECVDDKRSRIPAGYRRARNAERRTILHGNPDNRLGPLKRSSTLSTCAVEIGAGEGIRTLDPDLGNTLRHFTLQHLFLSENPLSTDFVKVLSGLAPLCCILSTPYGFRSRASPLLPRAPPKTRGSSTDRVVIRGIVSWARLPNV